MLLSVLFGLSDRIGIDQSLPQGSCQFSRETIEILETGSCFRENVREIQNYDHFFQETIVTLKDKACGLFAKSAGLFPWVMDIPRLSKAGSPSDSNVRSRGRGGW